MTFPDLREEMKGVFFRMTIRSMKSCLDTAFIFAPMEGDMPRKIVRTQVRIILAMAVELLRYLD